MKCKDCGRFKPGKIEAAGELMPKNKAVNGKCGIDNNTCNSMDDCNCGGFTKK